MSGSVPYILPTVQSTVHTSEVEEISASEYLAYVPAVQNSEQEEGETHASKEEEFSLHECPAYTSVVLEGDSPSGMEEEFSLQKKEADKNTVVKDLNLKEDPEYLTISA